MTMKERGKVIIQAESKHTRRGKHGIRHQVIQFFLSILVIIIITVSIYLSPTDFYLHYIAGPFIIIFFSLFIAQTTFSTDKVYENGISTVGNSFEELYMKKTFRWFKDVQKIKKGIIWINSSKYSVIILFSNNHKHPLILRSWDYSNDYLGTLERHLKSHHNHIIWERLPENEIIQYKEYLLRILN